jgi:hypothetical protein
MTGLLFKFLHMVYEIHEQKKTKNDQINIISWKIKTEITEQVLKMQ